MTEFALDVSLRSGRASSAPPDRVTMRWCIGCGARNLDRECTGECSDRRIEFVAAADHERLLEQVAVAGPRIAALRAVARRLARSNSPSEQTESAFRDVQTVARDALRSSRRMAEVEPAERVAAWWCATCGRIEAPQDCIGVCVRRPEVLVSAAHYDDVLVRATAARRTGLLLAELASMVASVSPRGGQWERNWQAMRSRARAVLAATET